MIKSLLHTVKGSLPRRDPQRSGFIDVRQLIAELSDDELMASADAYFAPMQLTSEQCRKPYSNPADAVHLTRHMSLVLEAADLFRGARVMELGCGTGWLSIGMAQMGCEVTGVDISAAAVRLAGQVAQRSSVHPPGRVEFLTYDGKSLPLADASVDRIVCHDAFHHVRDQAATLREFARVLRDGGRVAFIEPGPHHSRTPQSQAEMANFKVIENDVCMEEVTRHAVAAGLEAPQMLMQFQQPFTLGVEEFNAWAKTGIPRERAAQLIGMLQSQMTNGQCFFIYKGQPTRDSRRADGLAARLQRVSARRVPYGSGWGIELAVDAVNTGTRSWIAATLPAGQVNLGVHVLGPRGELRDNNYARLRLPRGPVAPGESVLIEGVVREPSDEAYTLRLDLVAEMVAWFADLGQTQPLRLGRDEL
ncbi:MAG: class I SAM-dependent methyltransferase [Burkholderiaceae bacterium]|nr:class I SAM-dependent methyltransferase [Burkholderiaceae bacterium]